MPFKGHKATCSVNSHGGVYVGLYRADRVSRKGVKGSFHSMEPEGQHGILGSQNFESYP